MSSPKKPDKKDKNPYKKHTMKEVLEVEEGHFYIQIGDDMFESDNGKLAFSKDRSEDIFRQIKQGLKDLKKHGTQKEKDDAKTCLLNFRIIPLRFH